MTLTALGQALKQLSPTEQSQVRGLFVSVDPARDSVSRLGEYVGYFGASFSGATADMRVLQQLASAFDAPFEKVPAADGEYEMSHSASIYVLDRDARLYERLDHTHDPQQVLRAVRRALAGHMRTLKLGLLGSLMWSFVAGAASDAAAWWTSSKGGSPETSDPYVVEGMLGMYDSFGLGDFVKAIPVQ
jgi:hypothetical protein